MKIRMNSFVANRAAAIACAAGAAVFVTDQTASAQAGAQPQSIKLFGVIRDFQANHADFNVSSSDGLTSSAGNVAHMLDRNGKPVYTGSGAVVLSPATDVLGRAIAPSLAFEASADAVTDFETTPGRVVPSRAFAAQVEVLGAAITASGEYDMPVTVEVRIGADTFEPFGQNGDAMDGNVNDHGPRRQFVSDIYASGSAISVTGTSWQKRDSGLSGNDASDWENSMTVISREDSPQVKVLRDGDTVPNIEGFMGQGDIESFVRDFIDEDTNTVSLDDNQAIYLFELGTTDLNSSAADFQDLVVLVSLATDPEYFDDPDPEPNPLACGEARDIAADLGAENAGGIDSPRSFRQWFREAPGANISTIHGIELVRNGDNYEFTTEDFHPVDRQLYGNESDAHNRNFTYEISARFIYTQCSGQFIQVAGEGDAWLFVDGELVMDLGGAGTAGQQYVEMDRLGLADGAIHDIRLFYAQRSVDDAAFSISTNMALLSKRNESPTTNPFD